MVHYSGSTFFSHLQTKAYCSVACLGNWAETWRKLILIFGKLFVWAPEKRETVLSFSEISYKLLLCCFNLRFKRFLSFSFHLSMLANNKQFTVFLNRSFFPLFNCICLPTINYDPYRSPQCSYCASTNRPNITCPWVEFAFSQTFPKFEFPARMQISNFRKSR